MLYDIVESYFDYLNVIKTNKEVKIYKKLLGWLSKEYLISISKSHILS